MPIFKKRGPELVDITELQKKGTFQRSQRIAKNNRQKEKSINDEGIVDLTVSSIQNQSQSFQATNQESSSPLSDFLSSMASVNSSSETSIPSLSATTSTKESSTDMQAVKIKLEDLEFKLDKFITRLQKIEEKFDKVKD